MSPSELTVITRPPSAAIAQCELTYREREPLDAAKAFAEHLAYCEMLVELGARLVMLPQQEELPDATFVEDSAVVLDELAVIARMAPPTRRAEAQSVIEGLKSYRRRLIPIVSPGTLEGGDVIAVGKTLFVGRSSRSNDDGIAQLQQHVAHHGYRVVTMRLSGCLHLRSACNPLGNGTFLINPEFTSPDGLTGQRVLRIDPSEPHAANVLFFNGTVMAPDDCPRTTAILRSNGFDVRTIDVSELTRAEGGLSCLSLRFAAAHAMAPEPSTPGLAGPPPGTPDGALF
jgi:dimethylargininase